jgi:hypothetical protein
MVTARVLEVTHNVDDRVADNGLAIENGVASIHGRVRVVEDRVATVIDSAHHIFDQSSKKRLTQCA